ncbi:MAG: prepilin peptidase [Sphingomonadaceae bacterium]|nr:prepilin peptidase [Sphingomonadaceae bacterium]
MAPVWRAIGGAVLGAIIGSFLATLVVRWPTDKSVVAGRSRCDGCNRALRPHELIPLFSYLIHRGRCARCGARIDPVHFLAELVAAGIGAASFLFLSGVAAITAALLGWALLVLAALDLRHFWLPDRITLPLVFAGLGFSFLPGGAAPLDAAIAATAGFALLFLLNTLYRMLRGRDGLGLGDAKLFAAAGAWLGWQLLPFVLLLSSAAALIAIAIRALRSGAPSVTEKFPFGAFLAVSIWVVWVAEDSLRHYIG